MRPQRPFAIIGRLATLLLGVVLLAMAAVATRYLLSEQSHGDPRHIHPLLDKVLP